MAIENETADQVVRMMLQGSEVILRLTGEAALRIAPMIYAALKDGHSPMSFNDKEIISKPIEIRNVFKKGSAIAGYINYLKVNASDLKMTPPDNLPSPYVFISKDCSDEINNYPILLFTRKPGMIVSYETTGDWTNGILFIRGEYPIMDLKYDLMKHPKIAFTEEGGAAPFIHGKDTRSEATVCLVGNDPALRDKAIDIETLVIEQHDYEVFSNEDLEEQFQIKEI